DQLIEQPPRQHIDLIGHFLPCLPGSGGGGTPGACPSEFGSTGGLGGSCWPMNHTGPCLASISNDWPHAYSCALSFPARRRLTTLPVMAAQGMNVEVIHYDGQHAAALLDTLCIVYADAYGVEPGVKTTSFRNRAEKATATGGYALVTATALGETVGF